MPSQNYRKNSELRKAPSSHSSQNHNGIKGAPYVLNLGKNATTIESSKKLALR